MKIRRLVFQPEEGADYVICSFFHNLRLGHLIKFIRI